MKCSAFFITINSSKFSPSKGEISIGTKMSFINHDMEWAVHWFNIIILFVHLHIGIHTFLVEAQMTASFPKPAFPHLRRIDYIITIIEVSLSPEIFDFKPYSSTFGVPVNKSSTSFFMRREEIQLFTKFSMVSFLSFFKKY